MAKETLNYKSMKIDDIINWCVDNNEVEWLQNATATKMPCKVYPRKKVPALDPVTGEPVLTKKGRVKMVSVADHEQTPTIEYRPIGFIQLKDKFVDKFMPEIKPVAKAKEPNMYDTIKALKVKAAK